MSTNKEKFLQENIAKGVCDERGAVFCATAVRLPDGNFGMVTLGVKGNVLSIFDCNMKGIIGEALYSIPLKDVSDVKINDNFFAELIKGYSLRFTHNGFTYTFKNAAMQKNALAVIRSEAK